MPHLRHTARRLVAQAAITDHSGDPATWLHHDIAYFDDTAHPAVAKACRTLLRAAGGHPTRKTPGPPIPPRLRGYGITGRELQILEMIANGMTNNDIAAHLVLSTRTVETRREPPLETQITRRSGLAELLGTNPTQTR